MSNEGQDARAPNLLELLVEVDRRVREGTANGDNFTRALELLSSARNAARESMDELGRYHRQAEAWTADDALPLNRLTELARDNERGGKHAISGTGVNQLIKHGLAARERIGWLEEQWKLTREKLENAQEEIDAWETAAKAAPNLGEHPTAENLRAHLRNREVEIKRRDEMLVERDARIKLVDVALTDVADSQILPAAVALRRRFIAWVQGIIWHVPQPNTLDRIRQLVPEAVAALLVDMMRTLGHSDAFTALGETERVKHRQRWQRLLWGTLAPTPDFAVEPQPLEQAEPAERLARAFVGEDTWRYYTAPTRTHLITQARALALPPTFFATELAPVPVHVVCPQCQLPHVDKLEADGTDWRIRHHRKHLCHGCGNVWAPFPFHTVGVAHPDTADAERYRELRAQLPRMLPKPEQPTSTEEHWLMAAFRRGDRRRELRNDIGERLARMEAHFGVPTDLLIRVRRVHAYPEPLELPKYQTEGAAALDLCADFDEIGETQIVPGGEDFFVYRAERMLARSKGGRRIVIRPGGRAAIPTNLVLAIPKGFEGQLRPRSGIPLKHGVIIGNSPATLDSDFRGQVMVILINLSREPFEVARGDRLAQLVVAPTVHVTLQEVDTLDVTERGEQGFGSTGITTMHEDAEKP